MPNLAMSLNNLAERLGELGRGEEGLAAIEEATQIYRQLTTRWPDVYKPGLDRSLAVLAWLSDLGDVG